MNVIIQNNEKHLQSHTIFILNLPVSYTTRVTRTHIFSSETCQKLHLLRTATYNVRFEHFPLMLR